jgi:hypothetical protein
MDINYFQTGEVTECGHCHPEKGYDLPEKYNVVCACKCHKVEHALECTCDKCLGIAQKY